MHLSPNNSLCQREHFKLSKITPALDSGCSILALIKATTFSSGSHPN